MEPPAAPTCRKSRRSGGLYLNLDLVTFNQGAYGGVAVKPTSLALNLEFTVPEDQGPPKAFLKSKHQVSSAELARWGTGHDEGSGSPNRC